MRLDFAAPTGTVGSRRHTMPQGILHDHPPGASDRVPARRHRAVPGQQPRPCRGAAGAVRLDRSEEHTSELQSRENLVCRLLLEKKKKLMLITFVYNSVNEHLFLLLQFQLL